MDNINSKEYPENIKFKLTPIKVWRIKNPSQYGGISKIKLIIMALFWPIGIIGGFILSRNNSDLKKNQGQILIIVSIIFASLSIIAYTTSFSSTGNSTISEKNDEVINIVKNESLSDTDSEKTLGNMLENYSENPKWKKSQDSKGNIIVTFTGRVNPSKYNLNKPKQNWEVQFIVDKVENGYKFEFKVNKFLVNNEVLQGQYMTAALLFATAIIPMVQHYTN